MNLMTGPRDWWSPRVGADIDDARTIYVRPAVRRYDLSRGFDNVRARLSEWLETRFPLPEGGLRAILDVRAARSLYRALKRLYHVADEILFGTERDYDWLIGCVATAAVTITGIVLSLTIWRGW